MLCLQTRKALRTNVSWIAVSLLGVILAVPPVATAIADGPRERFSIDLAQGKAAPKKTAEAESSVSTGKPREPATAEQAAKVLDLRAFPLMEGAKTPGRRRVTGLHYEVEADVKSAFEFSKQQLLKQGWKELPNTSNEATFAGGYFTKDGFTVYVSVSQFAADTSKKNVSQVLIGNYGNVDLARLPVPAGVKPFYSTVGDQSYITDAKVPDTTEACRKLLVDAGWEPYGIASSDPASPMLYFKRNAVRLMAWISSAPAQGGKTVIKYSTEQLSADLPMPTNVPDPRYSDEDKSVRFDWPGNDASEVISYYQAELAKRGWKPTTDAPIVDEEKGKQFLVFRNPQKDMVSLDLNRLTKVTGVLVQHRTAAEVDEMDRQFKEAQERAKAELARKKMKVKVPLPIPAQAKEIEHPRPDLVEFTLKTGGGPGAFEGFREHFVNDGWKEGEGTRAEATIGRMQLTKGDAALALSYFDTGIREVDISITGTGIILEPSKGKSAAGEDSPKTAAKGSKKSLLKDIPGLPAGVELPDLGDDVPEDVQDLVKKALEDAGVPAKAKKNGKTAPVAGAVKVAEIPFPEDATDLQYNKTSKMIEVKTPSDVKTLAEFFDEKLTEKGWSKPSKGLISENSGILKFSQGDSELTVFLSGREEGSEATLTTKGLSWESVPPSKKSAKKATARTRKKKADPDSTSETPTTTSPDEPKSETPSRKAVAGRPVTVEEQKQTGSKLTIDNKVYKLEYGVAFESAQNDQPTTEVLLTEKPIAVDRIIAALKLGKEPDVAGFQRHLKLRFDESGKLSYLFMYADGLSINRGGTVGSDFMDAEIALKDGRARGKGVMKQPEKFFEQSYRIESVFDVKLATGPADPNAPPSTDDVPADGLIADEEDGLPFPDNKTSRFSSTTPFRKTVTVVVPSTIEAVSKFYQRELAKRGWKENAGTKVTAEEATLSYSGTQGDLRVKLSRKEGDVTAILATRNTAKAKADGILPQANRGRLILANGSNQNVVLTINGQKYTLAAGKGAKDPKDGTTMHVLPGRYEITIQVPGQADQKEELKIAIDETWGVIVLPTGGALADQLY